MLAFSASLVHAEELRPNDADKSVIGHRIARLRTATKNLRIESGDTVFILRTLTVNRKELPGLSLDYEGIVGAIKGASSIIVSDRIDSVRFERAGRNKIKVHLRYAIGVKPLAKQGGRISFRLSLVKRKGFGQVALSVDGRHYVRVRRPIASRIDVAADFRGYRLYQGLAAKRAAQLKARGIKLSLQEDARLPPLLKSKASVVRAVIEFDQWKRRMWIAHRHLVSLAKHPRSEISSLATRYLQALARPEALLASLPNIPLHGGHSQNADAQNREIAGASTRSENTEPLSTSINKESSDIVQPLRDTARSNAGLQRRTRNRPQIEGKKTNLNVTPIQPSNTDATAELNQTSKQSQAAKEEEDYVRGKRSIPSHPRFLRLADPNVAFGVALRFSYQTVSTTETAQVPTLFAQTQLALTSNLGLLITLPLAHIVVDLDRTEAVTTIGNPSLTAKYRFHLPNILGHFPSLTLRTRWSIPFSHGPNVPPTRLSAEEFALAANFTDTSAFLFERHGLGAGLSSSWQLGPIHLGGEFLYEYLMPIADSLSRTRFSVLSYGGGLGYRPFSQLGAYIEAQGAMLLIGPRRNEVTLYGGLRSQMFDVFELAVWVAHTIAPDARASNLAGGGELRFVYDVDSVILFKGASRKFGEAEWAD